MHRVDAPGATIDGRFTDGNKTAGIPATVLQSKWQNTLQDELVNVVEAAGIVLDESDQTQLLQAIQSIVGGAGGTGNAIINGDFSIFQRKKSPAQTLSVAAGALSGYILDRWLSSADTGVGTGSALVSRQIHGVGSTPIPGSPRYLLRHSQNAAATAGAPALVQRIERVQGWSGANATLRVWLKASASLDVTASVTQNFGTGGSPSSPVAVGTPAVFSLTTAWQRFDMTVALPSVSGKTLGTSGNDYLEIRLAMPAGQTYSVDVSRAQFALGDYAPDFEVRPDPIELLLCRRYYEKSYELETDVGDSSAGNEAGAKHAKYQTSALSATFPGLEERFAVEKRTIPTVVWYSPGTGAGTPNAIRSGISGDVAVTSTINASRRSTGYPGLASAPATNQDSGAHWTADAEI